MNNIFETEYDFSGPVQESYNISSSRYTDLFNAAFTPFSPDTIINGNNNLKSGQFDMDIEDSDLKLGYINPIPSSPLPPARFQ